MQIQTTRAIPCAQNQRGQRTGNRLSRRARPIGGGPARQPGPRQTLARPQEVARRRRVRGGDATRAAAPEAAPNDAPNRDAATVAVKPAIGNLLSLPHFGKDVPLRIEYSDEAGQGSQIQLARCLLDVDILQNRDWTGSLPQSITLGLERWVAECDGLNVHRIGLDVFLADSKDAMQEVSWHDVRNSKKDQAILGLIHGESEIDVTVCCMGYRVWELEQVCTGAGFAVARLAQEAAYMVNGYTPLRALSDCETRWEYFDFDAEDIFLDEVPDDDKEKVRQLLQSGKKREREAFIEEQSGALSPDNFKKKLPRQLLMGRKPSMAPIRRALKETNILMREPMHAHLLNDALALHQELAKLRKSPRRDLVLQVVQEPFPPLALCWQKENDVVARYLDDQIEDMNQTGEVTSVVWFTTFDATDRDSARAAVQEMTQGLRVVAALDRVIVGLHDERAIPVQSKTLLEVFDQEIQTEDLVRLRV